MGRPPKVKTSQAQLKATAKYDQTVEHLHIRVPTGTKEKLDEFVKKPDNKYTSVKELINELIEDVLKDQ